MNLIKRRTEKVMKLIMMAILCAALLIGGFAIYGKAQQGKIPELTFMEALEYTTKNNADAIITVGLIKDNEISYKVYGENGKELSSQLHTYEIGSITKTFTAALINKAISEKKININDTIDCYLSLPVGNQYPTIKALLTHTSGYEGYYFENEMIANFFMGRNDFYGISKEKVIQKASALNMDKESYAFNYSNFGYAIIGLVLEAVYDCDYTSLVNDFIQNELALRDTKISDQSGDLNNYWDWQENDAYLPAGGITSNISDMLSYAKMQLDNDPYFLSCHKSLKTINASSEAYKTMGINMDEIGMAWILDNENNIIWHNGGTDNANCYIGFNPEMKTAVVVLSNLAPNERIPATVLGVKLLMELVHV